MTFNISVTSVTTSLFIRPVCLTVQFAMMAGGGAAVRGAQSPAGKETTSCSLQ